MKTWFEMKAAAGGEKKTEVMIFDEIGIWGITAKDFATALKAIPDDHAITVRINSPGGSVFDGYAIFNALKSRAANVTTRVEGLAASMASIVALAGSKVTAAANSMFMIHNPWSGVAGDSEDLRKTADLLDKLTSQIVGIYAGKTNLPEEQVRAAMDAETWFTAEEAKEWGLVDEITDGISAVASFDVSRFRNAPQALAQKPSDADAVRAELEQVKVMHSERITELKADADGLALNLSAAETALASAITERDAAKAELAKRDAEAAVDTAINAGRLAPTARAEFVALFLSDVEKAKAILAAIPQACGNPPVPPEDKGETSSDAQVLAEYRALKGDTKYQFFAKNKDAIWRAASAQ